MKLSQLILISLIVKEAELASEWSPLKFDQRGAPMVWVDGRLRNYPVVIDTFFDRVVSIALYDADATGKKNSNEGIGVLVTKELVLTSFNTFRKVSSEQGTLDKIIITWVKARMLDDTGKSYRYRTERQNIKRGRQVIPPIDYESRPIHMKHGPHSPLHDLMVMRLTSPAVFATPIPPALNAFKNYWYWKKETLKNKTVYVIDKLSPIRTILAKPGETLTPDKMKFASIGHIDDLHIVKNRYLELGKFGDIVDCEEWIPRDWGLFICLKNTENYPGLGNGAVLFSGEKLFGIGSFMLKKGESSILVFTDVRPYWHLLYRTCTEVDQKLLVPSDLGTSATSYNQLTQDDDSEY